MTPLARILAFVTGLAMVFGLGLAVGRAVGPNDVRPVAEHGDDGGHAGGKHDAAAGEHGGHASQGDLRLDLDPSWRDAGPHRLTFRVLDPDGEPVTSYDVKHERRLHLIVVDRASLNDYHHLHPELGEDGVWSVPGDLAAGSYRVYADGSTGGQDFVAESTVRVAGEVTPAVMPPPGETRSVDGYDVHLDVRDDGAVTLRVTRAGEPVDDLEQYLGAYGHLVVIRAGSLDYVHAHPQEGPAGPEVTFEVGFDRPGKHRMFFEFQHGGAVHTVAFTYVAGEDAHGGDSHGH